MDPSKILVSATSYERTAECIWRYLCNQQVLELIQKRSGSQRGQRVWNGFSLIAAFLFLVHFKGIWGIQMNYMKDYTCWRWRNPYPQCCMSHSASFKWELLFLERRNVLFNFSFMYSSTFVLGSIHNNSLHVFCPSMATYSKIQPQMFFFFFF